MITMVRARMLAWSVVATAAVVVALTGCSAPSAPVTSPAPETAAPAVVGPPKATPGVFNSYLAYQTAWHVVASSTYVKGSADTCDINLGLSFEDAAALSNPDTTIPVYGFVMQHSGDVSYGTVWPTAQSGTGITDGTGKVTISYDEQGLPTVGDGTANLIWHDASRTPAKSQRTDQIHVTFTAEPRAKVCP